MGIVKKAVFSLFHFPGSSPKDCPRELFILCYSREDTAKEPRLVPTSLINVMKEEKRLQPSAHSTGHLVGTSDGTVGLGHC